jgi:hypothetical protein
MNHPGGREARPTASEAHTRRAGGRGRAGGQASRVAGEPTAGGLGPPVRALVAALAALLATAAGAWAGEAKVLRIVKQPGLGYLQLIVMRDMKRLEIGSGGFLPGHVGQSLSGGP